MPELPEVETVRLALEEYLIGEVISSIEVVNPNLRWKVNASTLACAVGQPILQIARRSKYLILQTPIGFLLSHLGMTGKWRIVDNNHQLLKHDCLAIHFKNHDIWYNDVRRFGSFEWIDGNAKDFEKFSLLGAEPLYNDFFASEFDFKLFYSKLQQSKLTIKQFLMNNKAVVGVGNIYANETLFLVAIHPEKVAQQVSQKQAKQLYTAIIDVLKKAVSEGGTTLKDFRNPSNQKGYFQISLSVYGRDGEKCVQCPSTIKRIKQNGRASFFCPSCQN